MKPIITRSLLLWFPILLITACGGGGGDPASGDGRASGSGVDGCLDRTTALGIEGTGVRRLMGMIDSIATDGTVIIGCVRVAAADAIIFIDGAPGYLADLRPDQIVIVDLHGYDGETGSAIADRIYVTSRAADDSLVLARMESQQLFSDGTYLLSNGTFYAVPASATVLVDGELTSPAGLNVKFGELVSVRGAQTFDTQHNPGGVIVADRIEVVHEVDGPVDALDLDHARILVLGQSVVFDRAALSEGTQLTVGSRLIVSGHRAGNGEIMATFIGPSASAKAFLVAGPIESLDETGQILRISNLTVEYSAAHLEGLPGGKPTVGLRVIIRGERLSTGNQLTASEILYDGVPASIETGVSRMSLHGMVTSVNSTGTSAVVDGYPVAVSADAITACGSPPVKDTEAYVIGNVLPDGGILAYGFCFDRSRTPPPRLLAPVDSVDPVYGTLLMLGMSVQPLPGARIVGGGLPLTGHELQVGDWLEIYGSPGPGQRMITAGFIQRVAPPGAPSLTVMGHMLQLQDPLIYVPELLEQPIAVDGNTVFEWIDNAMHQPKPLNRSIFFDGERSWPFWDRICRPSVTIEVRVNEDGTLTATLVLVRPDYC